MTDSTEAVRRQLADELAGAAWRIGVCVLAPDEIVDLERRVRQRSGNLAAQLVQEDDDRLSAQTVIDVMCALWPHCAPEDVEPGWWRTALGRAVARSVGHDTAEAISGSVAGAMLGVTPGRVSQLASEGRLDRHPDGGIVRASVLQLIAERG